MTCSGVDGLFRLPATTLHFPDRSMWEVAHLLDGWRMPYFDWLWLPNRFWFARLEEGLLVLAVLLTVGLATRLVAIATATTCSYLFLLSQWNFHHHLFLFLIVLWILAATPCGRHFSLDALLADPRRQHRKASVLTLRLLQLLVLSIYAATFLWKCNGVWMSGEILEILRASGSLRGPLAAHPIPLIGDQGCSLTAWLLGGLIPLGLVFARTRRAALATGIMFHLGIDLSISVGTFSYQMLSLYLVFTHPECGATVVLYDGECSRCARSRRWLNLLDWFRRISWVDFRDPKHRELGLPVSQESLSEQMHVATPDGRLLCGFFGWRDVLCRSPLSFLPALVLYVPPLNLLGPSVYHWFARKPSPPCPVAPTRADPQSPWQKTLRAAAVAR